MPVWQPWRRRRGRPAAVGPWAELEQARHDLLEAGTALQRASDEITILQRRNALLLRQMQTLEDDRRRLAQRLEDCHNRADRAAGLLAP